MGRIDVHSHLLPGVDDGCDSLQESIACAKMLVAVGYTHSFCTPHVVPNTPMQTNDLIQTWVAALQEKFNAAGVPLTLMPGGEINLWPKLIDELGPDRLMSYRCRGEYCLVDIWTDRLPEFFEPSIKWLQAKGLKVILAHPERMRAVQLDPDLVDYFDDLGLLLQGNLQPLSELPGKITRMMAERFLTEGRYFMLGSDLHKLDTLPARMAGLQFAIDLVGKDEVNKLTVENPKVLVGA